MGNFKLNFVCYWFSTLCHYFLWLTDTFVVWSRHINSNGRPRSYEMTLIKWEAISHYRCQFSPFHDKYQCKMFKIWCIYFSHCMKSNYNFNHKMLKLWYVIIRMLAIAHLLRYLNFALFVFHAYHCGYLRLISSVSVWYNHLTLCKLSLWQNYEKQES